MFYWLLCFLPILKGGWHVYLDFKYNRNYFVSEAAGENCFGVSVFSLAWLILCLFLEGTTQWEEPEEVAAARAPPSSIIQPEFPEATPSSAPPPIPKFDAGVILGSNMSQSSPPALPSVRPSMLFSSPPLPSTSPSNHDIPSSAAPATFTSFTTPVLPSDPVSPPERVADFPASPALSQARSRVALEMSGYLQKKKTKTPKGPVTRKLEKRFFVLRNKELIYYESNKSTEVRFI